MTCDGQAGAPYGPIMRIERGALSGVIQNPLIASYDLSSDGKTIALLVISGTHIGSTLSVVTMDTASKRIQAKVDIGPSAFPGADFALQLAYSADQRYLVVQDLRQVRVYKADGLTFLRSVANLSEERNSVPLFILPARTKDVVVCAFGTPASSEEGVHTTSVYVETVDLVSGTVLAGWNSEDIPQAVSPSGELVAVSSSAPVRGILPLNIFDTKGHRISALDGGFGFQKTSNSGQILGRVRGIFLSDDAVLLSADEHVDRTGHRAGSSIAVVSISNGKVRKILKPKSYSPTGDLAISQDGNVVLVGSWDLPAKAFRQEERPLPASSTPMAFLISGEPQLSFRGAFVIQASGLNLGGWLDTRRTRFSSDGSVIAIAQDDGITLFSPK